MDFQQSRDTYSDNNIRAMKFTRILFLIYLCILVWILVFKLGAAFIYAGDRRVNLIPFNEPLILNGKIDYGEMILNVLVFVPFGIYAAILFKRFTFGKNVLLCFLASLICEVVQITIKVGSFDITDVITNTIGGVVGLILCRCLEALFANRIRIQKAINAVASFATLLIILFLLLLKLDMLPVRYQ